MSSIGEGKKKKYGIIYPIYYCHCYQIVTYISQEHKKFARMFAYNINGLFILRLYFIILFIFFTAEDIKEKLIKNMKKEVKLLFFTLSSMKE